MKRIRNRSPGALLALLAAFLAFSLPADAANTPISGLTNGGLVAPGDEIPVAYDGQNFRVNVGNVAGTTAGANLDIDGLNNLNVVIGNGYITNAMLAGSIVASKLVGSDIATLGTVTAGTWQATPIANAYLANSSLTLGSTSISLGSTASSVSGLALAGPTLSGTITLSGITGSTQCLQVNSSGVVSGTSCGGGNPDVTNATGILPIANGGSNATTAENSIAALGAQPRVQIIGTRTGSAGNTTTWETPSNPGYSSRELIYLPYGGRNIQAVFGGWNYSNNGETSDILGGQYYATSCTPVVDGSGYALGDKFKITTATNSEAPYGTVTGLSGSTVTGCAITAPGILTAQPSTGLPTVHQTGGGNDALTVTIGTQLVAHALHVGFEQAAGTQTAYSYSNANGVRPMSRGSTVNGLNTDIYINPFDYTVTDPVMANDLPPGTTIGLRIDSNGFGLPESRYGLSTEIVINNSFTNFNASLAWGSSTNYATGGGAFYQPLMLLGELAVPKPSFIIFGDSITQGTASTAGATQTIDTADSYGDLGWVEKALAHQVGWTNFSEGGVLLAQWIGFEGGNEELWKAVEKARPSDCIDEMGVNDQQNYSTLTARKLAFWTRLKAAGCQRIWATTITPNNTGSPYQVLGTPSIATPGSGYGNTQTWTATLSGGTCTTQPTVSVTSNSSGVPTTINSVSNIGVCSAFPTSPVSTTGGSGTGLTLTVSDAKCQDTTNQVIGSGNSGTQGFNTDLRNGVYTGTYIYGVLDVAAQVESSVGSGIWAAGLSDDCLHPTTAEHTALGSNFAPTFSSLAMPQ